jgi:hypothetical protein
MKDEHHRLVAGEVLERHRRSCGKPIELPVPIELIIEGTYGLEIVWDPIDEPADTMILGALFPREKRIVLNDRHIDMFEGCIGPERFTLAHELAHWIYDADDPNQLTLDFERASSEQFCYHRESQGLSDNMRIREINANKFASHLLLPEFLVRAADLDAALADIRGTATRWGVSQQALRIRLDALGLNGDRGTPGPNLL